MRILWALALAAACTDDIETDDDIEDLADTSDDATAEARLAEVPGVNGDHCIASPYNCRFHAGSSRVVTAGGDESWGVEPGAHVRDGNGHALVVETRTRMTFNYGQTRLLAGKAHALALTTSNGSAAWYPIDRILGETSFRARMGEVNARDPHRGVMACYAIRNSHDPDLELKKVVRDSHATHERAGDYLPLPRANGGRSANLVFSVPGFGLGGATTDHFPAGTRFQRVSVPTFAGPPSITIKLWSKASNGHYTRHDGDLRFFYGFVRAADGVERFGWMAEDALEVATGC